MMLGMARQRRDDSPVRLPVPSGVVVALHYPGPPVPRDRGELVSVTVKVPAELLARIDAAGDGLFSRTKLVRAAIADKLDQIERRAADPSLHQGTDDGDR
jgi:hypothetical protein